MTAVENQYANPVTAFSQKILDLSMHANSTVSGDFTMDKNNMDRFLNKDVPSHRVGVATGLSTAIDLS